jgi:hypothetical protein
MDFMFLSKSFELWLNLEVQSYLKGFKINLNEIKKSHCAPGPNLAGPDWKQRRVGNHGHGRWHRPIPGDGRWLGGWWRWLERHRESRNPSWGVGWREAHRRSMPTVMGGRAAALGRTRGWGSHRSSRRGAWCRWCARGGVNRGGPGRRRAVRGEVSSAVAWRRGRWRGRDQGEAAVVSTVEE